MGLRKKILTYMVLGHSKNFSNSDQTKELGVAERVYVLVWLKIILSFCTAIDF